MDFSTEMAIEKAAASCADYHGLCWANTFPDHDPAGYPAWSGMTDAHRLSAKRSAIITIYAYLHFRSEKDRALEVERLAFFEELEPEWRPVVAKALGISSSDLSPRAPRHAFGADLSDPTNDLFAFAWDQNTSASLLIEGYRREEIRRLEYKAFRLKSGPLSAEDIAADDRWAKRNMETFSMADAKSKLAIEARAIVEPRP
jgi:hypothetical protein